MRLYTYLNEETISDKISIIKKECSDFLNDIDKDHILYRGLWSDDVPNKFVPIKVNKNRVPRNTNIHVHNLFDLGFKHVYNTKARSECVFCSGNKDQTKIYGNVYIVFPVGKYEAYWSPYIHDLFSGLNSKPKDDDIALFIAYTYALQASVRYFNILPVLEANKLLDVLEKYDIKPEINDIFVKLKDKIDKLSAHFIKTYYIKGNIKKAIESKNEIMIDCDKYYVLEYSKGILDNVWPNLFSIKNRISHNYIKLK